MANLRRVQNMVAVVTGAATGIGFASSKALLVEGATVLMTDIDESNLNRSYKELSALGLSVSSSLLDVTDENAWQVIMDRVIKDYGRLDILLNNAGVVSLSLLKDQDMEEEYDTIGGLVSSLTNRIPVRGEVVRDKMNNEYSVVEADPRSIKRLRVFLAQQKEIEK